MIANLTPFTYLNWNEMSNDEDTLRRLIKEAIKEWMDDQFAAFGRWTIYGILSAALGAVALFTLYISTSVKITW